MEFQTLKKSYKKQIVIGALAVCVIGGALTFATTRAKYKLTQDIPLVRGTINYKVPDMRIVALYIKNDNGEYVENNDIPKSGYQLNREKSMCRVYDGSTSVADAPKDEKITIEYRDGEIYIGKLTKKNTRCYLYFDKYIPITIPDIIASVNSKDTIPDFSKVATTDEGVYKVSDPVYGGTSYYWRGAVTNNYVKFGGFCWRIVRINGDGSMRLIYDGATCHTNGTSTADSIVVAKVAYNTSSNQSNYVGWTYSGTSQRTLSGTSSNAKKQLESWYNSNIGNNKTYTSKIADGKYCNDRNVASGYTWAISPSKIFLYAARTRLEVDYAPTLACNSGDVYTLKVGLITADEVEFAGGKEENNSSYYLYNEQRYWTMSPAYWNSDNSWGCMFKVNNDGRLLDNGIVDATVNGLRPVINLRSDVIFSSGNGTQSNPYVVSD